MSIGRSARRQLVTGEHVVADISCKTCDTVVGWKYVDAKERSQRYKIGKFILETERVVGEKAWEDIYDKHDSVGGHDESMTTEMEDRRREDVNDGVDVVVFDSEDEDECDDLFAGVWTAEAAGRRRRGLRVRQ